MSPPFQALKNRNYRLYFSGQLVSMIGTWMQSTVLSWLVYRLSHSATWLGIIAFSTQLPAFLASPMAGLVADRKDRRTVLLWVEIIAIIQAFMLAALFFSGKIALWHIAALSIVLGIINAFEMTTRHAFAVDLVGKTDLPSALAFNSVTINGSRMVGPAIAGLLIAPIGEGWCFVLNGLSYLAVILGLLLMKLEKRVALPFLATNPFSQIWDAFQYTRQVPRIARLILLSAFISFFGAPYVVLLPVFAKEALQGDALTLGWLTGTSGLGAICGAFEFASRSESPEAMERKFPIRLILVGLSLATLGASSQLWLSLLATFGIGFFMMAIFPSINTTIQQIVDDSYRGRVVSLYTMSFLGTMPLGGLLAGWLADRTSALAVELSFGAIFLIVGITLHLTRNCNYRGK
ncbi:MAG: hypothetical protein A2428_15415 [Bdellovibrionales bacterium RIFOXYC1_FULL_54_43]|nr:MAG: hypothetical protein A2428_15415 [Bdellovibrionales bacterium RIFOXYC1_FULL_54_43]OFZ84439.1 MAG: hypothetical protein A2603_03310 [Bdellovibrionales bacterium RIFOXYD1_FULL_55_31]